MITSFAHVSCWVMKRKHVSVFDKVTAQVKFSSLLCHEKHFVFNTKSFHSIYF